MRKPVRRLVTTRRFLAIGAVLLALAGVLSVAGVLLRASAGTSGVDQAALQACIDKGITNCQDTVPGLAQCMAEHGICNEAAFKEAQEGFGPLQPVKPGTVLMSRDDAIGRARQLSPSATASSPVFAQSMTLAQFEQLARRHHEAFGRIDPNRIVWVVTVHAPMETDGSPRRPPETKSAYTVIFDAATSTGIETCIGCATLG